MGGKPPTVYQTDPHLVNQIKQNNEAINKLEEEIHRLRIQYQKALDQAKKLQDPALYRQLKQKTFQTFVDNLKTFKFTEKIERNDAERYYVLIGNISSGKTSLINRICDLKLPVGLGECTSQTKCVAQSQDKRIKIFDSPGVNEDFSIYTPETLNFFFSMDKIFILYPQSIKNCKQIVVVLSQIKPNDVYMVRTKCDTWTPHHSKTIKDEIETDKKYLETLGLNIPVLATSSFKDNSFLDNAKFAELLKN